MNTTTTAIDVLELFYAFFVNPLVVVRIYQICYPFTFLLGFLGNIGSLLTFSRPTLRKLSTGFLFILLAISDMLYLLSCIFDFLEFGLKVPYYHHVAYNEFCRFRTFLVDVAQLASGWILVIVSIDRWIRTRFPSKSCSMCTPKKALLAVAVLLVVDVGLNSQILTPMFGMLIPGFSIGACGPSLFNAQYFTFYYMQWSIVQIFTTCLIPVIIMLIILIDIFIIVRVRERTVVQSIRGGRGDQTNNHRQRNLQKQMFILMFASICIFFITNLPVSIFKITSARQKNLLVTIFPIISAWTGLQWFQSLNFAVNFYIHCLTSTLFRKEFRQRMKFVWGKNQTPETSMDLTKTNQRIQTHQISLRH